MESQCTNLIDTWVSKVEPYIEEARDAHELDITAQEARDKGLVNTNETYIGRRVIASNIQREMPVFLQYLRGSHRHISLAPGVDVPVDMAVLQRGEIAFTKAFRTGNWLETHMQTLSSIALHGRGALLRSAQPISDLYPLNTSLSYVAPEDFIFPLSVRNMEYASLIGIRYVITYAQLLAWSTTYGWDAAVVDKLKGQATESTKPVQEYTVYLMMRKQDGIVMQFWYNKDQNKLMTQPVPYAAGAFNPDGTPIPSKRYPVYPIYYDVTETPRLIERHGRAFKDMHDQEALTVGWTAYINANNRASELYISLDQTGPVENPEITQTDFIMEPGTILKKPVRFHSPPTPDGSILATLQALRTENAQSANQMDFAASNKKDSRKTATELQMAAQQSANANTVSLTMLSIGYTVLMQDIWNDAMTNVTNGYNTVFMANDPARAMLAALKCIVTPSGDIDILARDQKLKDLAAMLPLFDGTPVGIYIRKKMLELQFPQEYAELAPMLEDNSKQLGAALYQVLLNMPQDSLTPQMQQQLQTILQQAKTTFDPEGKLTNAINDKAPPAPEPAANPGAQPGA